MFIKNVVKGVFYGISTILGGLAASLIIRKDFRKRTGLLIILIVMFLCSTGSMTASICAFVALIKSTGQTPYGHAEAVMMKTYIVSTVLPRVNYVLSDTVIAWRAFVLLEGQSLRRLVLAIALLISSVAAIVDCTFFIMSAFRNEDPSPSRSLVMLLPMLFTNCIATSFITWRTWRFQKFETLPNSSTSRITRVMYLLIESGFVYCIIWILAILSTQNKKALGSLIAQSIFAAILPHIAAIYPTLIILLMSIPNPNIGTSPGQTTMSSSVQFPEYGTGITVASLIQHSQGLVTPFPRSLEPCRAGRGAAPELKMKLNSDMDIQMKTEGAAELV